MDQQLRCTQDGHENKLIDGICMAKSCHADQRILCMKCLKTNHAKCQNQFCDQNEFIQRLIQLKTQVKEPAEISQLRQLKQGINKTMKVQQFMNQILQQYKKNSNDIIDNILKNQQILSAKDWKIGYELLTAEPVAVHEETTQLIQQLNKLKESIDLITNSNIQQQDSSQIIQQPIVNAQWNKITVSNPVIINPKHKIMSIALSPDEQHIASAGCDGDFSICIWNLMTGQQVGNSLNGHTDSIRSIDYSKCGQYIVSCSKDKTIRQWSLSNYQQFGQTIFGHQDAVRGVECSPNKKYIVSCSQDKTLRIWDLKTGKELVDKQIKHKYSIDCLSLSPTRNEVVFGDSKGTLTILDYENHKQRAQLIKGHNSYNSFIMTIKYSKDGKSIISGGGDKLIILWDAQTKKWLRSFSGHRNSILSVNFSPDQKYIISGGYDKKVRLWNRVTGKQIICLQQHNKAFVTSTQFSLCGNYVITGGFDKQIRIMMAPCGQACIKN